MRYLIATILLFCVFGLGGFFVIKEISRFYILGASADTGQEDLFVFPENGYEDLAVTTGINKYLGKYVTVHYEFSE